MKFIEPTDQLIVIDADNSIIILTETGGIKLNREDFEHLVRFGNGDIIDNNQQSIGETVASPNSASAKCYDHEISTRDNLINHYKTIGFKLQEQVLKLQKELAAVVIVNSNNNNANLEAVVKERDATIEGLERDCAKFIIEDRKLKNRISELERDVDGFENAIIARDNSINELNKVINNYSDKIDALEDALAGRDKRINELIKVNNDYYVELNTPKGRSSE